MSNTDPNAAKTDCVAYGCPMLGVATRSTNGTSEWLCHLHMRADGSKWQAITAELNRLGWLVKATRDIRAHADRKTWPEVSGAVYRAINLAQRSDLQQKERGETPEQWGIRLEDVIAGSCAAVAPQPDLVPGGAP